MNKKISRSRRSIKTREIARQSLRPRLHVYRSNNNIYAQIIRFGDTGDLVIASASSLDAEIRQNVTGKKSEIAFHVGKLVAVRAKTNEVTDVAFDRAGYKYHGRVKAVADGAREAGLNF